MTTNKDDRDAMNLLHEVSHGTLNTSRNYRDASGPSNLWRHKPTKIPLPMNQNTPKPLGKTPGKATRPFKHNALDPYGNHRSGGRSSNPVASATYMSKRQKTDYACRDALSKPSFQTPRHEAPRLPPDDIMMVEDDSEDLGEPILRHPRVPNSSLPSPDPLDVLGERTSQKSCRATALGQKPPTPVGQHPFDSKPIKPLSIGTSNHTHGQLSSDPVEDSSPPPTPFVPLILPGRTGFVRSQADRINTNSRKPNVPHLDLKAKAKAKDKMKSKQGSLKITPQYQRSGRASKLSKGDEEGDLVAAVEVKVAYVGVQEESTPGMNVTLKKQDGDLRLSIMNVKISSPTSTLLAFNVATDISQIKMTQPDVEEKTLALQLVTQSKYSGRPRDTYKPGHEDLGRLLFLFDSEHRSDYRALFEGLKHTVKDSQYLGLSATKPMIEAYQRTAHAVAQSYTQSPSSSLPTRQPTSKPASGVKRRLSPDSEFVIPDYTPSSSNSTNLPTRRSARQSLQKDPVQIPKTDPEEIILVYPPNTTGAVTITTSDLMRLQPGEFLNDTLIEFGLKLWLKDLEDTRPELAKDVHVFNSFFYKKLKVRNIAEGYQSVRKWTSKFDLFQKKYLIVPINENLHWYLAIIYEPEHTLRPPEPAPEPRTRRKSGRGVESPGASIPTDTQPHTPDAADEDLVTLTDSLVLGQRPQTPLSEAQEAEVEQQLIPNSDGVELIGGGPSPIDVDDNVNFQREDSPLTDLSGDEIMIRSSDEVATAPGRRSLSVSEMKSPPIHVVEDVDMSDGTAESSEPVVQRTADALMPLDLEPAAVPSEQARRQTSLTQFYGKPKRDRRRIIPPTPPPESTDVDVVDVQEPSAVLEPIVPKTYIFTLDSLGTRHPAVGKTLSTYLKLEAKDKKNIDLTSDAQTLPALVPVQPNHCDCGVYLLHFAETFMKDPLKYCKNILSRRTGYTLTERQADWDDASVGFFRQKLTLRIRSLSEEWEKGRAPKGSEAARPLEALPEKSEPQQRAVQSFPETEVVPDSEESDGSIEFVEMKMKSTPRKVPRPRG